MDTRLVRSTVRKDEMMSGIPVVSLCLGMMVCLVAVGGCAAQRQAAESGPLPEPFVRELEDPSGYHLLLTGTPQTWGMRSGRVRLAPGQSIGLHNTKGNEELLVFLSGRGVAQFGGDARLEVGVGRVAYIPPQTAHDIVNTGTEPLIYVFCVAPAEGVQPSPRSAGPFGRAQSPP
jgi:mannose-6-phosphate isomerase-like protein (cupin superfamily)